MDGNIFIINMPEEDRPEYKAFVHFIKIFGYLFILLFYFISLIIYLISFKENGITINNDNNESALLFIILTCKYSSL